MFVILARQNAGILGDQPVTDMPDGFLIIEDERLAGGMKAVSGQASPTHEQ